MLDLLTAFQKCNCLWNSLNSSRWYVHDTCPRDKKHVSAKGHSLSYVFTTVRYK